MKKKSDDHLNRCRKSLTISTWLLDKRPEETMNTKEISQYNKGYT
jgi:hypothetical protein